MALTDTAQRVARQLRDGARGMIARPTMRLEDLAGHGHSDPNHHFSAVNRGNYLTGGTMGANPGGAGVHPWGAWPEQHIRARGPV